MPSHDPDPGDRPQDKPIVAVIDTQSLLDWRYFADAKCAAWTLPGEGSWHWLATTAMRDELAHVLARGFGGRWQASGLQVLDFFDRHASLVPPSAPAAALARALRCTDPDDQKFIDLAVGSGADWLVSRDRAVLKLRRRALALAGLRIVAPGDWVPAALPG
jgi:uncharacterized protein